MTIQSTSENSGGQPPLKKAIGDLCANCGHSRHFHVMGNSYACHCGQCKCTNFEEPVGRSETLPPPETDEQKLERAYLTYLLIYLQQVLGEIQIAITQAILYGMNDDGDGSLLTKKQVLESLFCKQDAVISQLVDMGYVNAQGGAWNFENYCIEQERIRQEYFKSSNRGLLRLPVVIPERKPLEPDNGNV